MKLVFKVTHNVYWDASMFSLVAACRGYVMDFGNPSKEMDTWKQKCEIMEQKCFVLHKDFAEMWKKFQLSFSLKDETKIHDSPITLEVRVNELEDALKAKEKRCQDASESANEMTCRAEEDHKILFQQAKAYVKALNTLEDVVIVLKVMLQDSLQQTMQALFGICDQVVEQMKRLCPTFEIPLEDLNPFMDSPEGDQDGGRNTLTTDASA